MIKNENKKIKPIPVEPQIKFKHDARRFGILMEILLLYAGLLGYIFCNTTALDMGIPGAATVLITAVAFALMIFLVWYKRIFFGVLGGVALLSLIAYPISFPLYRSMGRTLEICYNYTIYLLGTQEGYTSYLDKMTMDLENILQNTVVLSRHFYTAIILLSLIAALFFALALFRRIPMLIPYGVTMVGLIPFFLYGIVPHYAAFSLFLSALIGCYGQSVVQNMRTGRKWKELFKKREKKAKSKKTLTTAQRWEFAAGHGSFGMIIAGVMMVITLSTATFIYSRPILQLEQVRETIDQIAQDVGNTLFRRRYEKQLNVAGYMEEGETLSMTYPTFRGLSVLGVTSSTDTPIYLRFRTTVDFTPDGWSIPDDTFMEDLESWVDYEFCEYTQFYNYLRWTAPGGDPLTAGLDNIDSEEEGYITDRITVYPKYQVSDLLAIPKGAVSQGPVSEYDDLSREGDTILMHNDDPEDGSYMFQVTSPVWTSDVFLTNFDATQKAYIQMRSKHTDDDPLLRMEAEYNSFVCRNYTSLPDEVRNDVKKLANEISEPYSTKLERVQAIERYLRTNYSYSTTRQRLTYSDGTEASAYDYLNYFLFDNEKKEGYCTLFASAMVSMVRSLGYPARVVTGYYAQPQFNDLNNYGVELFDYNYHAWVEVYFDGMGWVTFEPTPNYGTERNYYLLELVDENKENEIKPNVIIVYIDDPDYIKYSNDLPDPTLPTEEEDLLGITNLATTNTGKVLLIVCVAAGVLLLLVGIFLLALFLHRRTLAKLRSLPPDQAVRKAYYMILRLMQMRGFKFFEGELLEDFARRSDNLYLAHYPLSSIVPLLQRALYSDLSFTEEEREAVVTYVESLNATTFRATNPFKAFCYRWLLGSKPSYKKMIWRF